MKPIEQIERIKTRVQGLVKKHHALELEHDKLKSELERKSGIEKELKEKVARMEEQLNLARAAGGQMDDTSKKAFEKQLNHYIKEIDRCIAMLSQ